MKFLKLKIVKLLKRAGITPEVIYKHMLKSNVLLFYAADSIGISIPVKKTIAVKTNRIGGNSGSKKAGINSLKKYGVQGATVILAELNSNSFYRMPFQFLLIRNGTMVSFR